MRTKNCKPAGDCCVVSGAVDGAGHLILALAGGQRVDVGPVLATPLPVVADGVTVVGDGTTSNPLKAGSLKDNGDGTYTWVSAAGVALVIGTDCAAVQDRVAPMLAPAFAYDDAAGTLTLQPSTDAGNHFRLGTDGKPYTAWPNIPTDLRLTAVAYDKKTKKLTFTLNDGSTLGPVDISDLLLVVADGVTVMGDGTTSNPLKAGKLVDNGDGTFSYYNPDQTQTILIDPTVCCPDVTQTVPAAAFVDPNQPTPAEMNVWAVANGPFKPGTQIIYPLNGTTADPDWVWLVDPPGAVTNVESPVSAVKTLTSVAGAQATLGSAGSTTAGVLNVPDPLPVARIVRTAKMGLTAAFDGSSSSGTQDGNPLTYAWSAAAGVAFGSASSPTTTAVFSVPGEYMIILTVTDANGNTATEAHALKVQRVIEVGGITVDGNDYVATLGAAMAWVVANGVPAVAAQWRIEVQSDTVELAQVIIPSYVHVFIAAGVQIFGSHGGANGVAIATATDASLNGVLTERPNILMTGFPNNSAQYAAGIFGVCGAGVSMTGIHASGTRGIVVNASGAPVLVTHCKGVGLHGNGFGAQKAPNAAQTGRHLVRDCEFYGGPDDTTHAFGFSGGDCLVEFVSCNFYGVGWQDGTGGANVGGVQVYSSTVNDLVFDRCSIYSNGVGAAYRHRSVALDRVNIMLLNSVIRARNGTAASISDVVAWTNAKIYNCVLQGVVVSVTLATPAATLGSNIVM